LYAPTFTANRIKLAEYGLADRQKEMIDGLVRISKNAIAKSGRKDCLVAGDLTMTGQQLRPMGPMEPEALINVYKEQILALEEAGVDLLVVETMMSLAEVRCALIAAKEVTSLPVMVTFTFEPSGRTLFGTDAATAAIVCESLGAAAIGVNCSTGPAAMKGIVEAMASVSELPLIAKPNAGLPKLDAEGKTVYDMDVNEFASEMQELIAAGASILGGCCGTTPEFIQALTGSCKGRTPVTVSRRPAGMRYLTSERQTLAFAPGDQFIIIGERINPTGKKALQAELREGKMDLVRSFAQEQEACGAKVLDINVGMGGIDEKAAMLTAIEEVTQVTNLPLSLDSSFIDVLEAALRYYPGRALVNSVSLETEKFEKLLPLVAKYGAMFILLPLSDEGLPKDIDEKKQIIEKIYSRALELGMRKEDIVVDGLVQTVGANANAGLETLETIAYATQNGFATVCGLSNISFGMPERKYVNSAFLTLAISKGLSMAISNPSQELLVCTAQATDLLLAKKDANLTYIETVSVLKEKHEKEEQEKARLAALAAAAGNLPVSGAGEPAKAAAAVESVATESGRSKAADSVYEAVLKGNRGSIAEITKKALDAGEDPQALLNDALIPAINEVGKRFDSGKYFLPQLIGSAEAMKLSIEVLEPLLASDAAEGEKAVVVIATVEGD
ncbi:MAG: homocysteine S-methyltransferase family protein, partial [Selenomonadaceae bacterium]|nr:homocysteine S-methyltransferase family protein [Selenomonadaceae bacterium]